MSKEKAPQRQDQLYTNLFTRRASNETLDTLSKGLVAIVENAGRLIMDVTLLADAGRYGSASFLLATADEEIAKSYILLDMCRLDFVRHENALRRLCRAFYDHVVKYAYNQVVRFHGFSSMSHVKEIWDIKTTRWWPSSEYDSVEPDMPHATYFSREMALYVDFIDQDQKWFTPQADTRGYAFEPFPDIDELSEAKKALDRLHMTSEAGLYRPESLSVLNDTFKNQWITERTPTEQIAHLYKKAAQRIEDEIGISKEKFHQSALDEWPLYPFVAAGP